MIILFFHTFVIDRESIGDESLLKSTQDAIINNESEA